MTPIDLNEVQRQIANGQTLKTISHELDVSVVTLWRRLKKARIDYLAPGRCTQQQKFEIAEMRERGLTYAQIARRFNVSTSAVQYHCLEQGAVHPQRPLKRRPNQKIVRGRPFTTEEDERMLELSRRGMTPYRIAKTIGRPNNSVRTRLLVMALAEEAEEAA